MTHYECDRCHQPIADDKVFSVGVYCYPCPTIQSYVTDGSRVTATAQWCTTCVDHFGIRPYARQSEPPSIEKLIEAIVDARMEAHEA